MDLSRFVVDAVVLGDFPRVRVARRPRKTRQDECCSMSVRNSLSVELMALRTR